MESLSSFRPHFLEGGWLSLPPPSLPPERAEVAWPPHHRRRPSRQCRGRAKDVQKFATICIPSGIVHESILVRNFSSLKVANVTKIQRITKKTAKGGQFLESNRGPNQNGGKSKGCGTFAFPSPLKDVI